MRRIELRMYKESKCYFQLFDIIFKDNKIKKEPFLLNIGISPSSYRKARTHEQTGGPKLVEQLCEAFGYGAPSYELICSIEDLLNKAYTGIYYKTYDSHNEDVEYIDNLISKNYIFNPVLKLIKLFILANSKLDILSFVQGYRDIYVELQNYLCFLSEDLLEILDILSFAFEEEMRENLLFKEFKNSLAYYSLTSRLWKDERYTECMYIADKTEVILVKELNYRRLVGLNVIRMYCLNMLENYNECFKLGSMQLYNLQSFKSIEYEYKYVISHLALSCLPLKKYEYCINLLLNKSKVSLTDICCLLAARYFTDKAEYESLYKHYSEALEQENKTILKHVDNVLKHRSKRSLAKLNNPKLMRYFANILKKVCGIKF